MDTKSKIKELVGLDLKGFKIVEMTEVYMVNEDGRKYNSLGFFKEPNIAIAFADMQTDANWHKTGQALVLTDGTIGYVIEEQKPVKLFNDEAEALEIKKSALAKLSTVERKILGFGN